MYNRIIDTKPSLILMLLVSLLLSFSAAIEYSFKDWRILVDQWQGELHIQHKDLGRIVDNIHLNVHMGNEIINLTNWSIKKEKNILSIETSDPFSVTWEFTFLDYTLHAKTSSSDAIITGLVPAPPSRIPVRIADPENMKTALANEDFTGTDFYEKSYIPLQAGNVMYLALGMVDALNLHSLFDRPTNTVIQFPDSSHLNRNPEDASIMDFEISVERKTNLIRLIPDYYTKVLGMPRYVPYDDTYHKTAPTGWNHWLAFFREVTEQDIVNATDWVAENLKDYGMLHIQLDDGYNHPQHRHWYKDWDKKTFPHGPKWLVSYIKSKGFIPGLWTVPYSYCVEHGKQEWFLRNKDGNIAMDYQGGGELDFSHPDVIRDYWRPLLDSLKSQGWEYYKFDMGSTVQMWEKYHDQFYDITKSCYDVSHETMKIFREIMGPEVWHTNHPDNWGGRMGIVDVVGCGMDPGPGWKQMQNFFEVISNNTYQNHIVWYSDPDCIVLRGKPTRADAAEGNNEFLNLEEARTCISLLSLAGLQFLSGDDFPNLEEERLNLIKKCIPIMPIFPIDLFGRGRDKNNYPEIIDLKVNAKSGIYDVIAVTNWSNKSKSPTVSFEKDLALNIEHPYVVFDFWNEKIVGVFRNKFRTEIPSHGTKVFMIRRLADRPQLLATNRHITGAFSIKEKAWNASQFTLSGTSETVPDVIYSLFVYIPEMVNIARIDANAENLFYEINSNRLLEVSFTGQKTPVNWKLSFKKLNKKFYKESKELKKTKR